MSRHEHDTDGRVYEQKSDGGNDEWVINEITECSCGMPVQIRPLRREPK
jgi:hypothetical protein